MKQRLSLLSTQSRVFIALAIVLVGLISAVISVNHYFNVRASTANSVLINAGGGADAPFVADEDFNGAHVCGGTNAAINTTGVSDPAPQGVYQTNRCGNFTYSIPNLTPSASYTVRLHFAETYWKGVGKRIFGVKLNGQQVLTNFDIFATAGAADKAVVEQFTTAADASGMITIQFITVQDNALVSGIEVLGGGTIQNGTQGSGSELAIDAGGPAVGIFVADEDFTGARACGGTKAAIDTSDVTDAAPQAVYQTNRCGNFTYTIPNLTANANYTVRLHFAETYWNAAGKRIFNAKLNGQQVLTNFDIFATTGAAKKAVAEQFTTTANASGTITIQFITVQDNALVSGIEIIGENAGQSNSQSSNTGGITPTPTTQSGSISPGNEIAWPVFGGNGQHSGVNPDETTITANNVGNLTRLWQQTLPGTADGAPVELPHVTTPLGIKDLLFVTTKAGSLIATDANTGALVWHADTPGSYITTSSPAIDPSGQFVYSYGLDGKVHKYKVGDGTEITNATWPATVTLLVNSEKGEPPITIANGYLYMTTAGHYGDGGHYEGHIIAVNLATGVETVFNALCANIQHLLGPNDCSDVQAGIWGRGAPEVDPVTGNLYVTVGNGLFDPSKHDYGDSVLELSPDLTKLLDSYTPSNFQDLQNRDQDLGSASPAILPKQANSLTPYMMVQAGKDSTLRLINRQNLSGQGGPNHVGGEIQALPLPQGDDVDTQPAVWTDASGVTWVFVSTLR